MDDDDLRRGRPTCHKAYDEATAVLVGDALQPLAFQLLARDPQLPADPAIRLKLIDLLAEASGTFGMAGGQAHRPVGAGPGDRHRRSRADACPQDRRPDQGQRDDGRRLRADAERRPCPTDLARFATAIGLAFQIQDDLLDVLGDVSTLGKATGADSARAKPTYPAVIGVAASQARLHKLHAEALAALAPFGAHADPLRLLAQWLLKRQS